MSVADGGATSAEVASSRFVIGLVVLVAVLIGANFSVMQLALDHTTPILLTGMRTAVGGLALLAYTRLRRERIPTDTRTLVGIGLVSICITTISSMSLVVGVSLVPAGVAALLTSLVPVWTALLAFSFLSERLNKLAVVGILTGLVGAVVLSSPAIEGETSLVGVVILVVSGVAWAAGIVITRWWNFGDVSSVMITTVQLFMSTLVVVPIGLIVEGTADTEVGLGLILPLLYAGIPSMAVTFALLAVVTRNASATQASATAYLTPVFGVLFAWIIRDNTLSPPEWIGGAMLVVGVVLVTTARAR